MADPEKASAPKDDESAEYSGPERRSGLDRRQSRNPQPPPGQEERRHYIRRNADRVLLERTISIGLPGPGGRLYRRVQIEVPVICRLGGDVPSSADRPLRGVTHTLAPGGLGMILDQNFPTGTNMEVLVRFEGDLVPADVQVVNVIPQGGKFLHNCRFTRLGEADRTWLIEYLRIRDARPV